MPLTKQQRDELMAPTRKDGRAREDKPDDIEAYITAPVPVPTPSPPVDHFVGQNVTRAKFVAYVKRFFPTEAAEFTDQEIGDYAQHYMDGSVADTIRMVGRHLQDRLAKRVDGKPARDDSNGLAALPPPEPDPEA